MMFRKADRERIDHIWGYLSAIHEAHKQWQATHAAQLKSLAEGQDRLLQSQAALAHEQQKEFAALAGYVGANQAVLDTLVQAVKFGNGAGHEQFMLLLKAVRPNGKAANGKRKRRAA